MTPAFAVFLAVLAAAVLSMAVYAASGGAGTPTPTARAPSS